METYRKQARGGKGIIGSDTKEGDFIEHLFTASTHDYLLIFTNRGKCYWLKVYDVPSMSRQSKGRNIVNLLKLGNQKIASVINVRNFDVEADRDAEQRQLIMATRNGIVKKTKLSAYGNPRPSGVIAINLDSNDDLIGVALTTGSNHIVLGTQNGMTIRFDEGQVRSMGRVSRGVIGIRVRAEDAVVDMVVAEEGASLLTVCENGYGKRTGLENYRTQNRGGVGLINIKTTARNGKVVALKAVQYADELMMITASGMIIRTGLDQIRSIGRNTQGVRLIKLKPGDKLVAAAKIISEDVNNSKEKSGTNQRPKSKPKPKAKRKAKTKSKVKPKPRPGKKSGRKIRKSR
ncbi:DNA gyrase subunit A [subsurface metagenome]